MTEQLGASCEIAFTKASLESAILHTASTQPPNLNTQKPEIKQKASEITGLMVELEKAAESPSHPTIYADTDVVWIIAGPGSFSKTPPFKDKEDRYIHLSWTRKMDRARLRTSAAIVRAVTALRTGKKSSEVTDQDIIDHGPVLAYTCTPSEGDDLRRVYSQFPSQYKLVPAQKLKIFDSIKSPDGTGRDSYDTYDGVESLEVDQSTRRIVLVTHASHLARVLYALGKFPSKLPQDTILQAYPLRTPKEGVLEYAAMEARGILAGIYRTGKTAERPYPFQLSETVDDLESIERIGLSALLESYAAHNKLGIQGTEDVKKNEYGDTALRGDIEAEEAIISVLKRSGVSISIFSEEHGQLKLSESPKFLSTLDGIDGSGLYKREFNVGRYGTMFSIYKGTDPTYDDYLFGGIMEHATGKLFFAVKGKGAFVLQNGVKIPISCSKNSGLDQSAIRIDADENFDPAFGTSIIHDTFLSKLFGFQRTRIDATAAHYADLASGACDFVLECTRKGNLELAVGYALTREAGGVIVDMHGKSLGEKRFKEFGQNEYTPFVAAANQTLAEDLLTRLTSSADRR